MEINIQGGGGVSVKGPKGQLHWNLPGGINLEQEGGTLTVVRSSEEREVRAMHGTARSLVANMIEGVVKGFTRELEIIGVGFRAAVKGKALDGALPIIGVGGIVEGRDAREKIGAGATLVQVYTGLVYRGPQLVKEIAALRV